MMSRTQITLDSETQRQAQQRASDQGVSFAEYVRGLVAKDLGGPRIAVDPTAVFDLGSSGKSNIAENKKAMVAEAFASMHGKRQK